MQSTLQNSFTFFIFFFLFESLEISAALKPEHDG